MCRRLDLPDCSSASSSSTFRLGIIGDHDFDRPQHRQAAQGAFVQVLADGMFEHRDVGDADIFGHADVVGEMREPLAE